MPATAFLRATEYRVRTMYVYYTRIFNYYSNSIVVDVYTRSRYAPPAGCSRTWGAEPAARVPASQPALPYSKLLLPLLLGCVAKLRWRTSLLLLRGRR